MIGCRAGFHLEKLHSVLKRSDGIPFNSKQVYEVAVDGVRFSAVVGAHG